MSRYKGVNNVMTDKQISESCKRNQYPYIGYVMDRMNSDNIVAKTRYYMTYQDCYTHAEKIVMKWNGSKDNMRYTIQVDYVEYKKINGVVGNYGREI